MLTDKNRLDGYVKALKEIIKPDSVVLDLGAGTGVFSVLACEFGAKKVYSVEVNHLINLLRDVIKERGLESKIEIIQKLSTDIELKQKANVLVSDIHGAFPLYESSIETIIDARERLLTPDAVMIPKRETIFFAVSMADEIYKKNVSRYLEDFYGFKIPSAERLVYNQYFSAKDKGEKLLTKPGVFAEIDYRTVTETSFTNQIELEIQEDGIAHGLRGWFENVISDGNSVTNAIDVEETTYASPFFPFENEVQVKTGDIVSVNISAKYQSGDYNWSWQTQIFEQGDADNVKASFNQSQLAAMYLDPNNLIKKSEYFTPVKNETAKIDLLVLNSLDGEMMTGDIADLLVEKYPEKFKTSEESLEYTYSLLQRYSE
jgi:protein arginine N-methyltransferase 1